VRRVLPLGGEKVIGNIGPPPDSRPKGLRPGKPRPNRTAAANAATTTG
jgi:hypothetical protein